MVEGRIRFPGNPWPDGHRVTDFVWTGRLEDTGLWFDFSLTTADYAEEGRPPDPEERGDWTSPVVWGNYHSCWLSSTLSGSASGVRAATPGRRFHLARTERLTADLGSSPAPDASYAFDIYLLGHDSTTAHEIEFTPEEGTGGHRIEWTGRIALTYAGESEYRHGFRAVVRGAVLEHIAFPESMPAELAARRLAELVDAPERFAPAVLDGGPALVPTTV